MGKKAISLFTKNKLILSLFFIFTGLSVSIAVVTFYGQNVGNLSIALDEELKKIGIIISDTADFSNPSNRLSGEVLGKAMPIAESQIIESYVTENDGSFKSKAGDYVGFTFYLKNIGDEQVSIDAILRITSVTRNVDEAVRIWLFEGDNNAIYKKHDTVDYKYPVDYKEAVDFVSDTVIWNKTYRDFEVNQVKKFSIIMWIEGEDPECTDTGDKPIVGGTFKLGMSFQSYRQAV